MKNILKKVTSCGLALLLCALVSLPVSVSAAELIDNSDIQNVSVSAIENEAKAVQYTQVGYVDSAISTTFNVTSQPSNISYVGYGDGIIVVRFTNQSTGDSITATLDSDGTIKQHQAIGNLAAGTWKISTVVNPGNIGRVVIWFYR